MPSARSLLRSSIRDLPGWRCVILNLSVLLLVSASRVLDSPSSLLARREHLDRELGDFLRGLEAVLSPPATRVSSVFGMTTHGVSDDASILSHAQYLAGGDAG